LKELCDYVISQNAETYIKILVDISDQEVKEKFKSSFVLLHTSKREGFGLSVVEAAVQGVPQILIDYDENFSTELEIVPNLICHSFRSQDISDKLLEAYSSQELYFNTVQIWLKERYSDYLGINSVSMLDREIRSFLG
jgi:glycosyltransferase involved in cell wall biosynthesis